jgi:hypothetical protein
VIDTQAISLRKSQTAIVPPGIRSRAFVMLTNKIYQPPGEQSAKSSAGFFMKEDRVRPCFGKGNVTGFGSYVEIAG